ncbi:hypothetical protein [Amycolatopsis antarctica]|uniref:hypothetical protein n=1 Tax=Amycolatopsis antarctica TaxID=1854586 RepID=UPI0026C4EADB
MAVVLVWLVLTVFVLAGWSRCNDSRAWRLAALGGALVLSLLHQIMFGTVVEDAYISFRYSLNLAEGNGPVFNPGERVEGYSNFLWTVLVAVPQAVFGRGLVAGAAVLGVICTLGCVLLAYLLVNRIVRLAGAGRPPRPVLGVLAAVLTAGASGLAAYGPSGLETPLFLLLVLATCYAVACGRTVVAGVLVALATMTRPDGAVVALIVAAFLVVAAVRKRTDWWALIGYLLGGLVLAVPWTAWRVTYYGHLLPNAVAAKSGGSLGWQLGQGWDYLAGFSLAHLGFLLAGVVAVIVLSRRRVAEETRQAGAFAWLLLAIAGGYLAFITYAGGDWMPAWRLLAPVPPLIAVAVLAAYGVLTDPVPVPVPRGNVRRRIAPAVALALCGVSLLVSTMTPRMLPSMREWSEQIAEMGEIGSWLGATLPPGTVFSTYANGVLSYRAGTGLIVVDVLGLTDEHIAREGRRDEDSGPIGHIANDYEYVVDVRRPSVAVTTGNGFADRQQCGIGTAYADDYAPAPFRRAGRDGGEDWVTLYLRDGQAPELIEELTADPRFEHVPCD